MPNYVVHTDLFSATFIPPHRNVAVSSDGTIWTVYARADGLPTNIYLSHSHDGGAHWTEEAVDVDANDHCDAEIAIDSTDVIHVTYVVNGRAPFPASYGIFYRQRSVAGIWSAEETISLLNTGGAVPSVSMAIDSSDDVHVAISSHGYGVFPVSENIKYRKRTAGAWGAIVSITDTNAGNEWAVIAIDSASVVHLAWTGIGWAATTAVVYCKSPLWVPEVVDIGITNDITDSIAVDSHDQPHIALYDTIGGWSHIYHTTKIAGVWSLREQVDNADGLDWTSFASIAIDKIDNLYFVYSGWPLIPPGLPINVMYRAKVSGVWQSQVNITTDPVNQQLDPCFCWATWPLIGGVRTNVLQGTQYLSWKSFNVAIMFGSYLLIFPLRSRSYALSRREL